MAPKAKPGASPTRRPSSTPTPRKSVVRKSVSGPQHGLLAPTTITVEPAEHAELEEARRETDLLRREKDDKDVEIAKLQRKATAAESLVSKVNLLIDNFSAEEKRLEDQEEAECRKVKALEQDIARVQVAENEQKLVFDQLEQAAQEAASTDKLRSYQFLRVEEEAAEALQAMADAEAEAKSELALGRQAQGQVTRLEFEVRAAQRDRRSAMEMIKLAKTQLMEKKSITEEMAETAEEHAATQGAELYAAQTALAETMSDRAVVRDELASANETCRTWRQECEREVDVYKSELAHQSANQEAAMKAVVSASHQQVKMAETRAKSKAPERLKQEIEDTQAELERAQRHHRREHITQRWALLFARVQGALDRDALRSEHLARHWAHFADCVGLIRTAKALKEDVRTVMAVAERWRTAAIPTSTTPAAVSTATWPGQQSTAMGSTAASSSVFGNTQPLAAGLPAQDDDELGPSIRAAQFGFKSGRNACWWSHLSMMLFHRIASQERDARLRALASYAVACRDACASSRLETPRLTSPNSARTADATLFEEVAGYASSWQWLGLATRLVRLASDRARSGAVRAAAAIAKHWRARSVQFAGRSQKLSRSLASSVLLPTPLSPPSGVATGATKSDRAIAEGQEHKTLEVQNRWLSIVALAERVAAVARFGSAVKDAVACSIARMEGAQTRDFRGMEAELRLLRAQNSQLAHAEWQQAADAADSLREAQLIAEEGFNLNANLRGECEQLQHEDERRLSEIQALRREIFVFKESADTESACYTELQNECERWWQEATSAIQSVDEQRRDHQLECERLRTEVLHIKAVQQEVHATSSAYEAEAQAWRSESHELTECPATEEERTPSPSSPSFPSRRWQRIAPEAGSAAGKETHAAAQVRKDVNVAAGGLLADAAQAAGNAAGQVALAAGRLPEEAAKAAHDAALLAGGSLPCAARTAGEVMWRATIAAGKDLHVAAQAGKEAVLGVGGSHEDAVHAVGDAAGQAAIEDGKLFEEVAMAAQNAVLAIGGSAADAAKSAGRAASRAALAAGKESHVAAQASKDAVLAAGGSLADAAQAAGDAASHAGIIAGSSHEDVGKEARSAVLSAGGSAADAAKKAGEAALRAALAAGKEPHFAAQASMDAILAAGGSLKDVAEAAGDAAGQIAIAVGCSPEQIAKAAENAVLSAGGLPADAAQIAGWAASQAAIAAGRESHAVAQACREAVLAAGGSAADAMQAASDAAGQAATAVGHSPEKAAKAAQNAVLAAGGSTADAARNAGVAASRAVAAGNDPDAAAQASKDAVLAAGGSTADAIHAAGVSARQIASASGKSLEEVANAVQNAVLSAGGSSADAAKAAAGAASQAAAQMANDNQGMRRDCDQLRELSGASHSRVSAANERAAVAWTECEDLRAMLTAKNVESHDSSESANTLDQALETNQRLLQECEQLHTFIDASVRKESEASENAATESRQCRQLQELLKASDKGAYDSFELAVAKDQAIEARERLDRECEQLRAFAEASSRKENEAIEQMFTEVRQCEHFRELLKAANDEAYDSFESAVARDKALEANQRLLRTERDANEKAATEFRQCEHLRELLKATDETTYDFFAAAVARDNAVESNQRLLGECEQLRACVEVSNLLESEAKENADTEVKQCEHLRELLIEAAVARDNALQSNEGLRRDCQTNESLRRDCEQLRELVKVSKRMESEANANTAATLKILKASNEQAFDVAEAEIARDQALQRNEHLRQDFEELREKVEVSNRKESDANAIAAAALRDCEFLRELLRAANEKTYNSYETAIARDHALEADAALRECVQLQELLRTTNEKKYEFHGDVVAVQQEGTDPKRAWQATHGIEATIAASAEISDGSIGGVTSAPPALVRASPFRLMSPGSLPQRGIVAATSASARALPDDLGVQLISSVTEGGSPPAPSSVSKSPPPQSILDDSPRPRVLFHGQLRPEGPHGQTLLARVTSRQSSEQCDVHANQSSRDNGVPKLRRPMLGRPDLSKDSNGTTEVQLGWSRTRGGDVHDPPPRSRYREPARGPSPPPFFSPMPPSPTRSPSSTHQSTHSKLHDVFVQPLSVHQATSKATAAARGALLWVESAVGDSPLPYNVQRELAIGEEAAHHALEASEEMELARSEELAMMSDNRARDRQEISELKLQVEYFKDMAERNLSAMDAETFRRSRGSKSSLGGNQVAQDMQEIRILKTEIRQLEEISEEDRRRSEAAAAAALEVSNMATEIAMRHVQSGDTGSRSQSPTASAADHALNVSWERSAQGKDEKREAQTELDRALRGLRMEAKEARAGRENINQELILRTGHEGVQQAIARQVECAEEARAAARETLEAVVGGGVDSVVPTPLVPQLSIQDHDEPSDHVDSTDSDCGRLVAQLANLSTQKQQHSVMEMQELSMQVATIAASTVRQCREEVSTYVDELSAYREEISAYRDECSRLEDLSCMHERDASTEDALQGLSASLSEDYEAAYALQLVSHQEALKASGEELRHASCNAFQMALEHEVEVAHLRDAKKEMEEAYCSEKLVVDKLMARLCNVEAEIRQATECTGVTLRDDQPKMIANDSNDSIFSVSAMRDRCVQLETSLKVYESEVQEFVDTISNKDDELANSRRLCALLEHNSAELESSVTSRQELKREMNNMVDEMAIRNAVLSATEAYEAASSSEESYAAARTELHSSEQHAADLVVQLKQEQITVEKLECQLQHIHIESDGVRQELQEHLLRTLSTNQTTLQKEVELETETALKELEVAREHQQTALVQCSECQTRAMVLNQLEINRDFSASEMQELRREYCRQEEAYSDSNRELENELQEYIKVSGRETKQLMEHLELKQAAAGAAEQRAHDKQEQVKLEEVSAAKALAVACELAQNREFLFQNELDAEANRCRALEKQLQESKGWSSAEASTIGHWLREAESLRVKLHAAEADNKLLKDRHECALTECVAELLASQVALREAQVEANLLRATHVGQTIEASQVSPLDSVAPRATEIMVSDSLSSGFGDDKHKDRNRALVERSQALLREQARRIRDGGLQRAGLTSLHALGDDPTWTAIAPSTSAGNAPVHGSGCGTRG